MNLLNKKDLRIGNWIDGIQEGCFSEIECAADIELAAMEGMPIKITDYMIEGIGFEFSEYRMMDCEESHSRFPAFYDGFNDCAICEYYHMESHFHGIIEIRKFDCDVIEIAMGNSLKNAFLSNTITRVYAFHQLQNVFWDVFFMEIGLKEI